MAKETEFFENLRFSLAMKENLLYNICRIKMRRMFMKRNFFLLLAAVLTLVCLTGCASAMFLDEVIPELMDITTQYPHVEKVTVTNGATGASIEYTDPEMQDNIRMMFEGVQCTRRKGNGVAADEPLFTVTFHAVDGDTVIYVLSGSSYVIGEYTYKAITFGVDTVYLENLFAE